MRRCCATSTVSSSTYWAASGPAADTPTVRSPLISPTKRVRFTLVVPRFHVQFCMQHAVIIAGFPACWKAQRVQQLHIEPRHYFATAGRVLNILMSMPVCHNSKTTWLQNSSQYFIHVVIGHVSPSLSDCVRYVMYFRFCGYRHVFTLWGNEPESSITLCFKIVGGTSWTSDNYEGEVGYSQWLTIAVCLCLKKSAGSFSCRRVTARLARLAEIL